MRCWLSPHGFKQLQRDGPVGALGLHGEVVHEQDLRVLQRPETAEGLGRVHWSPSLISVVLQGFNSQNMSEKLSSVIIVKFTFVCN